MTKLQINLLEVHGNDVITAEGSDEESIKSEFKEEAEELYTSACEVLSALGTHTLSSCVVCDDNGGVALRSANSSAEKFNARGVLVKGGVYPVSSLLNATN